MWGKGTCFATILLLCLSECFRGFWVSDLVQEGIFIYQHRIRGLLQSFIQCKRCLYWQLWKDIHWSHSLNIGYVELAHQLHLTWVGCNLFIKASNRQMFVGTQSYLLVSKFQTSAISSCPCKHIKSASKTYEKKVQFFEKIMNDFRGIFDITNCVLRNYNS